MKKNMMDRKAASRIQTRACKDNSGITPKNSFASRAMSAAYRNEPLDQAAELRFRTNRSPNFFEQSQSDSDSDSDSDSGSNNLMLALGVGALAVGAGLAIYAAAKKEEEQKNCCEKYCCVM
jgi:hypothetical protein